MVNAIHRTFLQEKTFSLDPRVEPPVSHYPKCKAKVVPYGRWLVMTGQSTTGHLSYRCFDARDNAFIILDLYHNIQLGSVVTSKCGRVVAHQRLKQ